ncbi:MAG: hypothetical protein QXR19_14705 [Candidatus Jordarchaeaceae archaeon]
MRKNVTSFLKEHNSETRIVEIILIPSDEKALRSRTNFVRAINWKDSINIHSGG